MKKSHLALIFCVAYFLSFPITAQTYTSPLGEVFNYRVVASNLLDPWEITYGPDNFLWVTESKGYKISRIDPSSGTKITLRDLSSSHNFAGGSWPQGGLTGLALHPQLLSGKPYLYLAYAYEFVRCEPNDGGCFFKTRIERYNYDATSQTLSDPVTLIDAIPGSNDHNGGRLAIAPVNGKNYLYYTVGDMGAGQFNNARRANNAQNPNIYEGKILRLNLEGDNEDGPDKWIPNDNPFTTGPKKSAKPNAVWSLGHRNPQGLGAAVVGGVARLYAVEHGPFSDDELNIIERQKNYGHPLIVGMNDGNYNGLAAAASSNTSVPGIWQTSCPLINSESANAKAVGNGTYKDPLKTFYPSSNSFLKKILTDVKNNNFSNGLPNASSSTWESEAACNVLFYSGNAIPGWNNSLLITTLKGGKVIRLQLNSTGNAIIGGNINYFMGTNRYRDGALSNDGTKVYLATDASLTAALPPGTTSPVNEHRGSILEFTYVGNTSTSKLKEPVKTTFNHLNIYPNPAKTWITVVRDSKLTGRLKYRLTDVNGKGVIEGISVNSNIRLDVSRLSPGSYILIFEDRNTSLVQTYKFVKE